MSIYIHIPFCTQICSYCDFPKVLKNEKLIDKYLISLEKEIQEKYKNEVVSTLYIGGGTPTSLSLKQLTTLFKIIEKINLSKDAEVTIEANTEDLTIEKLKLLKKYVNRLSIGIQTFNATRLKELNRKININNLKNAFKHFDNINIDLMYGFKSQTILDLKEDLEKIIKLKPAHISTYSLIIEPNTLFYINKYNKIDEDLDRKMYDHIIKVLKQNGYNHYEISNFAKEKFESRHNLVYWNNENYYGFGLGASGYLKNTRYENTRSLTNYLNGKYIMNKHKLTQNETIQNEFMLGFRKVNGINKIEFKEKYNINIDDIKEIKELLKLNLLLENQTNIYINPNYLYTSNEILIRLIDLDAGLC